MREFRVCDPLFSNSWMSESRAILWGGDAQTSLESAREGQKIAPGAWLSSVQIRALIALGEFAQAQQEIDTLIRTDEDLLYHRIMLAAAAGQKETANSLIAEFNASPWVNPFWAVQYLAWMGDRETANRLAAEVDATPLGHIGLMTIVNWCMCGAPWDLSATPNFAERLEESGLPWPPVSPLQFPFKDW